MTRITVRVSDELFDRFKSHKELNVSEIVRQCLEAYRKTYKGQSFKMVTIPEIVEVTIPEIVEVTKECTECGQINYASSDFCHNCGHPLESLSNDANVFDNLTRNWD